MRITQNMMTRNYLRTANNNMSNYAKSLDRMESGKKYSRISENVSDGVRALRVNNQISDNEQYLNNIRDAEGEMATAENNLKSMNEVLQTAQEKILAAKSDTYKGEPREIVGDQIETMRDQIVQFANAQYSEKFLFSGTNNQEPPFKFSDGKLKYNGIDVDKIYKDDNGKYREMAGTAQDPNTDKEVPQNKDVYIDMGLGIRMDSDQVDPASAFKLSFSGLDILGFGTEEVNGVKISKNIVNTLDTIAKEFKKPKEEYKADVVGENFTSLVKKTDDLVLNMTDIGGRCNFLEKTGDNLEAEAVNLTDLRSKLIGIKDTQEVVALKQFEYVMNLTLQFGGKVFPPSLMDFMR